MRIRQNHRWKPGSGGLQILFRNAIARGDLDDPWVLDAMRRAGRDPELEASRSRLLRLSAWGVGGLVALVATVIVMLIWKPQPGSGVVLALVGILSGGVGMAVWLAIHAGPSRWYERGSQGRCRGCGYDLGGVTAGLQVVVDGDPRDPGPANCPECGQVWPLVFPQ